MKAYDGWSNFLYSFGLKPWKDEDAEEGLRILRSFVAQDEEENYNEE